MSSGQAHRSQLAEAVDTRFQVRRNVKAHAAVTARTLPVSTVGLLVITGHLSAADSGIVSGPHDADVAAFICELPPITLWIQRQPLPLFRALHLDEPTFIVDYPAVLHRSPTAGYVVVNMLSGTIRSQVWEAGMGTYRSGKTWVEPAGVKDVASKNASAVGPARALVVLITIGTSSLQPEGD